LLSAAQMKVNQPLISEKPVLNEAEECPAANASTSERPYNFLKLYR
jgi:hypothetical protein